jgi:hypothetical protein
MQRDTNTAKIMQVSLAGLLLLAGQANSQPVLFSAQPATRNT